MHTERFGQALGQLIEAAERAGALIRFTAMPPCPHCGAEGTQPHRGGEDCF